MIIEILGMVLALGFTIIGFIGSIYISIYIMGYMPALAEKIGVEKW